MLAAAMSFPLVLAGCGVKGPLEPPAGAAVVEAEPGDATSRYRTSVPDPSIRVSGAQSGPVGRPVAPAALETAPASRRAGALDWLID
jgi:predicted small lipoprotein YifL